MATADAPEGFAYAPYKFDVDPQKNAYVQENHPHAEIVDYFTLDENGQAGAIDSGAISPTGRSGRRVYRPAGGEQSQNVHGHRGSDYAAKQATDITNVGPLSRSQAAEAHGVADAETIKQIADEPDFFGEFAPGTRLFDVHAPNHKNLGKLQTERPVY